MQSARGVRGNVEAMGLFIVLGGRAGYSRLLNQVWLTSRKLDYSHFSFDLNRKRVESARSPRALPICESFF